MGLNYLNLDERTRARMVEECSIGALHESPRMHTQGFSAWPTLFEEALRAHNDDWLARQIVVRRMLSTEEQYRTKSGQIAWRKVNIEFAAKIIAEGEFNRYYLRGLCVRAIEDGIPHLIVYRGRLWVTPRPESEAKIGMKVPVLPLLETLRKADFVSIERDVLAIPGGPNSGLTARLP